MSKNNLSFGILESGQRKKCCRCWFKKSRNLCKPGQVHDIVRELENLSLESTVYDSQGFGVRN
jgi:hypothetical protein